ncbi:SCO family protein [Vibrio furnissii]|uniref:SCO family protein n=1 Tax=Vibrio furnissii TaxID=29494 RepID=UPI002574667E|nr:SCO family protein [Vibrio furnissii]WJG28150.1 SCO family protein [Vibrio furnissii]
MSKNWSLILVVAFVLGFGFKSYLDAQPEPTNLADSPTVTLFGQDNQAVNIFDANDPRIRIVYFGFTRCPDVCPTSLAMLAGALNELDADTQSQVRPMFVSLDPERDNAQASVTYAHYFHPMIEGLSAPLDVTTALAHRYGVIFRKTELPNSELKYTLDHSSYFYFLQPDGTLITKVPHTQNPAPIVDAIKKTINTSKG